MAWQPIQSRCSSRAYSLLNRCVSTNRWAFSDFDGHRLVGCTRLFKRSASVTPRNIPAAKLSPMMECSRKHAGDLYRLGAQARTDPPLAKSVDHSGASRLVLTGWVVSGKRRDGGRHIQRGRREHQRSETRNCLDRRGNSYRSRHGQRHTANHSKIDSFMPRSESALLVT